MNLRQMANGVAVGLAWAVTAGGPGTPVARADWAVGFDTAGAYTASFWQSRTPSTAAVWQGEGFFRLDPANATTLTAFYDTFSPHDGEAPFDTLGGGTRQEIYSLAFRVGHEKESAAIAARVQGASTGTAGYGAWMNLDDGGKVLRLYRTPVGDNISQGTLLGSVTLEPNRIVVGTWYVIELRARNLPDGNVQLGARIADRATGATVGIAIDHTDTSASRVTAGGRAFMRLQTASSATYIDFDDFRAVVVADAPRGTVLSIR